MTTLINKIKPLEKKAWIPDTIDGDSSNIASKFSGTPYISENESYPICQNCSKPMQLFVQLSLSELPQSFQSYVGIDKGILQMFYCLNEEPLCEVECEAYFPFSKSTFLRIINPIDSGRSDIDVSKFYPAKTILSWNEIADYPNIEEMNEMGLSFTDDEESELYESLNPATGDKLGGYPSWVQGVEYPNCPKCQEKMQLIFQIDSEINLPYMFGDSGCGHITQCNKHKDVLAFGWACC
ncbi:YwqG family protein [Paenibacillus radicis (ex Xue et al. 2023)]|uniref:YwqG family protein n=1 Tax=Paenibacillus radicis (ex Xue et al. 2023) TaxID=2972489 RepID=A0ABT1YNW7_9BACL|nr:YwqG family protein [Paenibacillus radicis (ex Xue et al. 2023)]MCR8634871.1 YwqG family protein [Paenibacillus radicis (ex Xue et al. 2023)]